MLAVVALPGALVAQAADAGPAAPARHASQAARASRLRTGQVADSPVSVTITGMSPQWATPKKTVTVIAETTIMFAYSANVNAANGVPPYSV